MGVREGLYEDVMFTLHKVGDSRSHRVLGKGNIKCQGPQVMAGLLGVVKLLEC